MRYYLIAGEASGDLHGSNLMKELKAGDAVADFRFFGGDLMQAVQNNLVKHYREMAFMGILNVVLNIRTIKRNMELCQEDLLKYKPDVLILIDYPGFNLRIAEFAKQHNIRVFYYISPKLWAWKEYRVKKVKAFVDEMFTIFPFETEFYRKYDIDVHFVGNPLMDSLSEFYKKQKAGSAFRTENQLASKEIVALLAGSRAQEIRRTLPLMVQVAGLFPDFQFVVAGVKSVDPELYKRCLQNSELPLIYDQTYDLLNNSHAALVASGTAVLETALLRVPQTVVYKVEGGALTDFVFRNFIFKGKMSGVSLPNIIMKREIVREFIQSKMTLSNVKREMKKLLYDEGYRVAIDKDYKLLADKMGEPGCSKRAAEQMIKMLEGA